MTAKIEGRELVIRIAVIDPPSPSSTGKTLIVATTGGNQVTECTVKGQPLVIGLNAYIKNKNHQPL